MADPLIVKICGIKTHDLLDATIAAGADMVGFMHFSRSPRHVSIDELGGLISAARGRIESCVVLVNPDNSCVAEVAALGPDWIQLHGPETPHRVEAIRAEAGVEIIKALPIGSAEDIAQVAAFAEVADRILLDAKPAKGADRPLGSKETEVVVNSGDHVYCLSSGGGGYGNPSERSKEAEEWDRRNGYVG